MRRRGLRHAMPEHKLQAEVLTPEGEVFKGELEQLSTRTAVGEVGILANHAPLLARLVPAELRLHLSQGETRRYAQAEGWLEVFANKALVLIGEATPPDELDVSELKERLADAERRLGEAEEGSAAQEQAERDKARAEAFLSVAEGQ
jgi:F-type H+-transporting ATPase subunit epsilon